MEIKLGMTGPARLGISAGPGRYGQKFVWAGPRIYNPARDLSLTFLNFSAVFTSDSVGVKFNRK